MWMLGEGISLGKDEMGWGREGDWVVCPFVLFVSSSTFDCRFVMVEEQFRLRVRVGGIINESGD